MENSRRTLRTKNHCQQINNIFNLKTAENHLMDLLPPQIIKKLGKLQKISCCHINDLPQLYLTQNFEKQIQKCRIAQEIQRIAPSEYIQNSPMQFEKTTGYEQLSKNHQKRDSFIEQCVSTCQTHEKKKQNKKSEETLVRSNEIFKDSDFLQILNQFVMLGKNNKISFDDQLFDK